MFVSYPMNPLLVRRCSFCSVLSFEHVQNFPSDKTDRDARLMYGHYVAYTLTNQSLESRASEEMDFVTGKPVCMFCLFSLRNKCVCRSDKAIKVVDCLIQVVSNTGLTLSQTSPGFYVSAVQVF